TKTPTDTPTPTTPAPPTNTPTATPLPPTPTPRPTLDPNAPLSSVNVSNQSGATGIRVNIRYADGSPAQGKYVKVWKQKQDVSGNPIVGDGVTDGRTDNTGSITFGLNPDTYVVGVGDIAGYPYGNVFNYQVTPNSLLVLDVQLGRMIIGIKNADGQPLNGRYTSISLQKPDISGNPVQSDRVADGRTDNTGAIVYDLTAGDYWVDIRDIAGYYWGNPTNWRVKSGETVKIILDLGRIRVGIKNADGRALEGKYVAVSVQKQDIDGKPIPGDRVSDGRTDNTGIIDFDLTPGNYAVYIGDIAGAPYGEQLNHVVEGAKTTSIIVTLGRVTVGLKDESGNPARGRYVALYAQQTDVAGNIIRGDRLIDGRTDDTGLLNLDITAGHYVMEIEGFALQNDVNVESGHVTFSDGNGFQVR
ncbi:MAG TPA: hypothetical protein VFD70_27105, partial [Anaerolineae bacterium]|nr:hypothetical protein [Anaerolineae bacterium]